MKQSWAATWIETIGNTATGFMISLVVQAGVSWYYALPLRWDQNVSIIAIFTVVSIARGVVWRRVMEALHVRNPLSPFASAVLAERRRQIDQEGWSHDHDDKLDHGELERAAGAYALSAASHPSTLEPAVFWPWSFDWWKPTDTRRDLVKATALLIAAGEKFDRSRRAGAKRK